MSETKIIFRPQDRLDIVDVDGLQEAVYAYIQEALGGILGQLEGCFSPFSYTVDGSNLTLSSCVLALRTPGLVRGTTYGNWTTKVQVYDPAGEGSEVVGFGAALAAAVAGFAANSSNPNTDRMDRSVSGYIAWNRLRAGCPYLWARELPTEESTAARRRWDVLTGAEVSYSATRRLVTRTEFLFADGRPGDDWSRIGAIVGWSGATPTSPVLRPISAWDSSAYLGISGIETEFEDSNRLTLTNQIQASVEGSGGYSSVGDGGSLGTILYAIRRGLYRGLQKGTSETEDTAQGSWSAQPASSLLGLKGQVPDAWIECSFGVTSLGGGAYSTTFSAKLHRKGSAVTESHSSSTVGETWGTIATDSAVMLVMPALVFGTSGPILLNMALTSPGASIGAQAFCISGKSSTSPSDPSNPGETYPAGSYVALLRPYDMLTGAPMTLAELITAQGSGTFRFILQAWRSTL